MSSSGQRVLSACVLRVGQVLDALAHRARLVADHGLEALAHRRVHVGVVEHLHRRLQVAQRRAAAFGEAVQQLVAGRFVLELARDVVEHQHEAVHRRIVRRGAAHRRHHRAQQLPGRRGGDELRRRLRRAALQPRCSIFSSACATSLRSNTA